MANPIYLTINAASLDGSGNTLPFAYDWRNSPFNVSISVALSNGTTVGGYTLEGTLDDLNALPPLPTFTIATANWVDDANMVNKSSAYQTTLTAPQLFGRFNVSDLSSGGSLLVAIVQGISSIK